jgi:hypothetical protein
VKWNNRGEFKVRSITEVLNNGIGMEYTSNTMANKMSDNTVRISICMVTWENIIMSEYQIETEMFLFVRVWVSVVMRERAFLCDTHIQAKDFDAAW